VTIQTDTAELVYVVPRALVVPGEGWLGIRTVGSSETLDTIATRGQFAPRPAMEQDPSYKQVIPYLVLRDGPRWFLMQRTRRGVDSATTLVDRCRGSPQPGRQRHPRGSPESGAGFLVADSSRLPVCSSTTTRPPTSSGPFGVVFVADG
jgi:hypothetical protein